MTNCIGPVPLSSGHYVVRAFERRILEYLQRREWVLLLGPRQHGKTSALIRVRQNLIEAGFRCCLIDLQTMPPGLDFPSLLEWFARGVASSLGVEIEHPPAAVARIEEWLALAIDAGGTPIVILIDEASSIRDEAIRNAFYGQLRGLKTAAASAGRDALENKIAFLFSGTFKPEKLVDELNSPFNVCWPVDTEDFTLEQVRDLAARVLAADSSGPISDAIYAGVGGQPHLVQYLLGVAEIRQNEGQQAAIVEEVERLAVEGCDHLSGIFRTILAEPDLAAIAARAATDGYVANDPANPDFKFMTTVGLLKRDGQRLIFRNMLYQQVASSSRQLRPEAPLPAAAGSTFFKLDSAGFDFVQDVEYREICLSAFNSAVDSANAGNYRMAIVGFGIALEGMLIDWLVGKPAAEVAGAIGRVSGINFTRFEDRTDPSTWRLVNLMAVARQLNGVRGALEVPESLRDLRNFVHPKVIKNNYIANALLQPEATAAGGLVGMVMRDIQATNASVP